MSRPCEEKHELSPDKCALCKLSLSSYYHQKIWGLEITVSEEEAIKQSKKNAELLNTKINKKKLFNKIKAFCQTLTLHIQNNYKEVTESQYKQRLDICGSCPNKSDNWECNLCGCSLPYKAKWAVAKCDAKKWPLLVIDNKKGCVPCGKKSNGPNKKD